MPDFISYIALEHYPSQSVECQARPGQASRLPSFIGTAKATFIWAEASSLWYNVSGNQPRPLELLGGGSSTGGHG
jgi:hypothetical protein